MKKINMVMTDRLGFHVRVASDFCDSVSTYSSSVEIFHKDASYNAKRVLGILSARVMFGDKFQIQITGDDEEECVKAIKMFFKREKIS